MAEIPHRAHVEPEGDDARIKRTRRRLAEALIALTLEKGYDALTIRDITKQAGVGYATFFRHYHDKAELLEDVLEVVLAEMLQLLQSPAGETAPGRIGALLFSYVEQNSELCRVLLSSRGSTALLQRMIEAGAESALRKNVPAAGSPVPAPIAAHHLVTSSIALVQWWLDHDMPYSPDEMGAIYDALISHPTHAIAFEPPQRGPISVTPRVDP